MSFKLKSNVIARERIYLMLGALFLSGVAAIINQIVWQRALKVYLAGSEAISSMIVVLVFMLGLGLGSYHVGRSVQRVKNPLRMLGLVEVALLVVNLLICLALSFDLAASANELQRAASAVGMPLRVLYALVSIVTLLVPCYLMGVTMPLVSEGSQRQFGATNSSFLTTLFFLNTLGAVAGGLASGYYLIPYLGQQKSLILAALLNGSAGVVLLGLRTAAQPAAPRAEDLEARPAVELKKGSGVNGITRRVLAWAFGLGFLALAYEMYLFRLAALAFEPLPHTFSAVLCTYLFIWSIGVFAARHLTVRFSTTLWLTGAAVAFSPQLYYFQFLNFSFGVFLIVQCLPCFGFGLAFGRLISESARDWGKDVGIFYFMNTIGSALGIVTAVLLGYRVHPMFLGWSVCMGYVALATSATTRDMLEEMRVYGRIVIYAGTILLALPWIISAALMANALWLTNQPDSLDRMYFGPEGVVEVQDARAMYWDGLWHSDLSYQGDHVGTNNWLVGVVPYLAHPLEGDVEALVIGLGTGITVQTLAQFPNVAGVDAYEINHSLKRLLRDFPEGTLHVGSNPKVNIIWSDGRTGMALSPKKYDIITQQPMYLKQAGSSILLSREYMELVRQRLKPGGVFAIYCNSMGNYGQAAVVRKTASDLFKYCESFGDGYMLVVSDSPFEYSREKIEQIINMMPPESSAKNELLECGVEELVAYLDVPRLDWQISPVAVTDDQPIVEYPDIAQRIVRAALEKRSRTD